MEQSPEIQDLNSFDLIEDKTGRIDAMCDYALKMRNVDPENCLKIGKKAYELSLEAPYRKGESTALIVMAYQHWHHSQIETALEELLESESIQKEIDYFRYLGEARMVRAMISWGKGNYDDAFSLVYEALNILEDREKVDSKAWLYWTLGVFNYDLKDYKKSLDNYEKALAILRSTEPFDQNSVAYTLIGIGCCYKGESRIDEAIRFLEEALQISKETNQWMQEARCHYELGLIQCEKGNLDKAKEEQKISYNMRKAHGTKPGMVSCLIALADIEMKKGDISSAMDYMEEALGLAKETNSKPKIYQCHEKLATLYKQAKDFEKALEHSEQFHKIRSEVVGDQTNNKLKELETKFATERSEKEAEIQRLKNVELKEAYDLVAEKNKEILDSIRYAKRIQSAILPPQKLVKQYLHDSFILYKPKDIVAGDFYWMEHEGDKLLFTAADCTGHGVPGAIVSVMCSNLLTKAVKELNILEPAKILDKTVDLLEARLSKSEEEIGDGMDLALCSLDLKSGKLEYSGANNPLYYIRNGELHEIKADKQPVGKYINRKPFTNHTIEVQKGDCFYIFSDGYADQFGGPSGKKFKYVAFKKLLLDIHNKPMEEQMNILDRNFEEWKGDLEQIDDICVIGLRI